MKTIKYLSCSKCGVSIRPHYLKDGLCYSCRHPESVAIRGLPTISHVIFRKHKDDGSIIAVFLGIPWSDTTLTCYQHIGQHGGCDYGHILDKTVSATPREFVGLQQELENIGYVLNIVKRR